MDQIIDTLEIQRLALQARLDQQKIPVERNRLGQFATPTALAQDILKYAATLLPSGEKVRRYLCRHRSPWYTQENRLPAPIVCTYLGRSHAKRERPFRFILNSSRATVANVYLAMYPTPLLACSMARDPTLIRRIWRMLNEISPDQLLSEGRVYGGGLHKLEPKELGSVDASAIARLIPDFRQPRAAEQLEMY